jgi:hypothetical protein
MGRQPATQPVSVHARWPVPARHGGQWSKPPFDSPSLAARTPVIAGPVKLVTLLSNQIMDNNYAVINGELPSRSENLFWMAETRHAARTWCACSLSRVFKPCRMTRCTCQVSPCKAAPSCERLPRGTRYAAWIHRAWWCKAYRESAASYCRRCCMIRIARHAAVHQRIAEQCSLVARDRVPMNFAAGTHKLAGRHSVSGW